MTNSLRSSTSRHFSGTNIFKLINKQPSYTLLKFKEEIEIRSLIQNRYMVNIYRSWQKTV